MGGRPTESSYRQHFRVAASFEIFSGMGKVKSKVRRAKDGYRADGTVGTGAETTRHERNYEQTNEPENDNDNVCIRTLDTQQFLFYRSKRVDVGGVDHIANRLFYYYWVTSIQQDGIDQGVLLCHLPLLIYVCCFLFVHCPRPFSVPLSVPPARPLRLYVPCFILFAS